MNILPPDKSETGTRREAPNYKRQIANKDPIPRSQAPNGRGRDLERAARGLNIHERNAQARLPLRMFVFWNLLFGPCLSFGACYLVLVQAFEFMIIHNLFDCRIR
jgi:hypothetical protein